MRDLSSKTPIQTNQSELPNGSVTCFGICPHRTRWVRRGLSLSKAGSFHAPRDHSSKRSRHSKILLRIRNPISNWVFRRYLVLR